MKNVIFLLLCICLFNNCDKSNEKIVEKLEYYDFINLELNGNNFVFDFNYNNENYIMMFHGKEIINTFHIYKNSIIDENIPSYILDFDLNEDKFIIDELNKSFIFNEKFNEKEIKFINVSYTIYNIFNENNEQTFQVSIVPTYELIEYLINLIDIYYLPLYIVKNNDTLSSICFNIYGHTNIEQIIRYNPGMKLKNQYLLVRPGEKIRYRL